MTSQSLSNSSSGMCLAAKPHAFGGAVLNPKHARELTPALSLAMASALSEHGTVVQYTVWITEAWRVLGWAEPSAALFWEIATMYHTLHVAARAFGGGKASRRASKLMPGGIPPILSCGSASSLGSANTNAVQSTASGANASPKQQHQQFPSSPKDGLNSIFVDNSNSKNKPAKQHGSVAASAKELPVWLVGTFLLLHCEERAFLRNVSGEDERRFGRHSSSHNSPSFSPLLSSLSPRTLIHAGQHGNNLHCTSYLLRHLRKFLLLAAVPHNTEAVRACAHLADLGSADPEYTEYRQPGSSGKLGAGTNGPDAMELRQKHDQDHGTIGMDLKLRPQDLERLNFVLQSPSGGLIDDPPLRICDLFFDASSPGTTGIPLGHIEQEIRKHLELELENAGVQDEGEDVVDDDDEDLATEGMSMLSLEDERLHRQDSPGSIQTRKSAKLQPNQQHSKKAGSRKKGKGSYHKELSYTNLRGTTILLKPNSNTSSQADILNANAPSSGASISSSYDGPNLNTPGRLHDLHISDCSDAHMYLLQPFEHVTIAACTGCTIVVGAVAGLLHVVDCERTTVTSAARRVLVSNSFDLLHCIFTPSPPLLVGDNRSCQFAPYNTYYDGLREDLLSTGLAAALLPQSNSNTGDASASNPTTMTIATAPNTTPFPALQCASNKWKQPVELAKLEIPQVHHNSLSPTSPTGSGSSSVTAASGADDRAVSGSSGSGKTGDDTMQTPILLPASEFHVLFVPLESELARMRRQQQQQLQQQQIMSISLSGSGSIPLDDLALPYSESAESMSMSPDKLQQDLVSKPSNSSSTGGGGLESQYCRNLSDVLQLSPFRLPPEFERRALTKADRIRLLQQKMQTDLTPAKQASVEEELNRGFRDWLVTSGNLRQVLDLVHLERRGGV